MKIRASLASSGLVLAIYNRDIDRVGAQRENKVVQKIGKISRIMMSEGYFFTLDYSNAESELLTCSAIGFLTLY